MDVENHGTKIVDITPKYGTVSDIFEKLIGSYLASNQPTRSQLCSYHDIKHSYIVAGK